MELASNTVMYRREEGRGREGRGKEGGGGGVCGSCNTYVLYIDRMAYMTSVCVLMALPSFSANENITDFLSLLSNRITKSLQTITRHSSAYRTAAQHI